jgi:uncharacterized membrane protein YbhN (UPF0104 family)
MLLFGKKNILPFIFSAILLSVLAIYIHSNIGRLRVLFKASLTDISLIILLILFAAFSRGAINYLFYKQLQIPLSLSEGFGLAILNTLGNLFPFSGGLVAKGVYLKKKYQVQFAKFFSATVSLTICFISVNGAVGLVGLHYQSLFLNKTYSTFLLVGFLLMTFSLVLIWCPLKLDIGSDRVQALLKNAKEGFLILGKKKQVLVAIIFFQLIGVAIVALRLQVVFGLFSLDISFFVCLIFAAVTVLTTVINILPGGIGIRESFVGGASFLFGYPIGLTMVAVAFDRVCALVVLLCVSFIYIPHFPNFLNIKHKHEI